MDKLETIFNNKNGFADSTILRENGISYSVVRDYIQNGKITRVRRGFYKWNDVDETNESAIIAGLFPDGILCMDTALFHYGYTDRTPSEWHIAVNKDASKGRFAISYPFIKPYYYEPDTLSLGISKDSINDVTMNIYDRDRTICEVLRYMNKIDKETFNKAIQAYVSDPQKNIGKLTAYAKKLRIYKKVQSLIGVWL